MSEMTPQTVRNQLKKVNRLGPLDSMRVVLLWEADRARIEALERALSSILAWAQHELDLADSGSGATLPFTCIAIIRDEARAALAREGK